MGHPLAELMEEVRDLFTMDSSNTETFIARFKLPGLDKGEKGITFICIAVMCYDYALRLKRILMLMSVLFKIKY